MTDKQIIIDGVDVSFCTHHYNGWSNLHRDNRPMCEIGYDRKCNPKHFQCGHYVECLEKQLKRKEQECEELKEQLERADEDIKMKCTRCAMTNQLDEQLDQLKQTLTEIKEIVETCSFADNSKLLLGRIQQILQRISEVEDV